MLVQVVVVAGVVLALVAVYKLWKAKKAVTGAAVVAQAEADLKTLADKVKDEVSKK